MLVEGDLRGHPSHGVSRLSILVERLRKGLIVADAEPALDWATDAVLQVDGRRGFGPVSAFAAVDCIVERAKTTGVAMASVRNSNHVGMLAPYVERMADARHIGLAFTTSEALVHPWGAAKPMVGTNPIGLAVPTTTDPLVLDMSTASVSMGKILDYATKSIPIPLGWAVDDAGMPTSDPRAASAGAISPFGGAKGYALGIGLEAMVGVLTQSALGTSIRGTLDSEHECSKGDVFVAICLERLGLTHLLPELDIYFDDVRASGNAADTRIGIPGDRARSVRQRRMAEGIPLHSKVWEQTLQLHKDAQRA
jgi:LDH2 family malate/lactate/ureidoglycolate dehydrogenase